MRREIENLIHELKTAIEIAVYNQDEKQFVIRVSEFNFKRVQKMLANWERKAAGK